jgi:hypothetical protein
VDEQRLMSVLRVAILDDYQPAALKSADWSAIAQRVAIDVFSDTIADEDLLVKRLADYDIVCAMRERTKFSASLMDRLPKLRYACYQSRLQSCGTEQIQANRDNWDEERCDRHRTCQEKRDYCVGHHLPLSFDVGAYLGRTEFSQIKNGISCST